MCSEPCTIRGRCLAVNDKKSSSTSSRAKDGRSKTRGKEYSNVPEWTTVRRSEACPMHWPNAQICKEMLRKTVLNSCSHTRNDVSFHDRERDDYFFL